MFASSRFPSYKIGANNQIMESKDDPKVLSMKDVVVTETAILLDQQKRLSVRDLTSKFEKGLAAAAKLSEEARVRDAVSLEKNVILKKLRDALEALKGHVAGRNKDDVEEAIAMWHRLVDERKELISGATKPVYAPEPHDVGRTLQADIVSDGVHITLSTTGPIEGAPGLGNYVEALVRKHDTEFHVVIIQMCGVDHSSESIHALHLGRMRIKLTKGRATVAKEYYSSSMQICGVRGGGNAAPQALFWRVKNGISYVLAFESEREECGNYASQEICLRL